MKKLFLKAFLFSSPLLLCLLFFFICDPFGVLFKNDSLAETSDDVIKTRMFLKSCDSARYNAFVFGNSRTHGFSENDWKAYIGQDKRFFLYGAPGESVLNIRKKIELINAQGLKISDALVLVDNGILENTDNGHRYYQGPVYNHSPLTSNISRFMFYSNYIRYYFQDFFFAKHIAYVLTGTYKEAWMKNAFKDPALANASSKGLKYHTEADSLLENDFAAYKTRYGPDYSFVNKNVAAVDPRDIAHLKEIKRMLDEQQANYKVIIPPDFSKLPIAKPVHDSMKAIFKDRLYDFSGKSKIACDSTLNYENLHFTTRAGKLLLDSLYR